MIKLNNLKTATKTLTLGENFSKLLVSLFFILIQNNNLNANEEKIISFIEEIFENSFLFLNHNKK